MMKLTIEKFQQLNNIALSDMKEFDKAIEFVRIFTGKTIEQIDDMSVTKFNKICSKVMAKFDDAIKKIDNDKPKNWIKVCGKLYYINYNIAQISANKYVETAIFSNDVIGNLHKILATMVYETKWTWKGVKILPYNAAKHEEISTIMLQSDFKESYHTALFFYHVFKNTILNLKPYLEKKAKSQEIVQEALTDFIVTMDGLPMPKWCQNLKISA
jgi:hypothetical protein